MTLSTESDSWLRQQRWREERVRFEVLAAVYEACGGRKGCALAASQLTERLGIRREQLFRALEFLDRNEYLTYHGAGPMVSIAQRGIDHIEHRSERRRSIRG